MNPAKPVATVQVQSITFAPGVKAPRHMHPCPTIGVVNDGKILFQVEGREAQHLKAGDAFYEPADVAIAHFDNEGNTPATFTVYYLLGPDEHETIKMLPK
jgi:quercetin dioxygenase-like cupin family protein